ncbi:MAG: hypothetical protein M1457_09125 [bacterium]|nr:hypothetical protein [bacterium]
MMQLEISGAERDRLTRLLEREYAEVRIEGRRTRTVRWREELEQDKNQLKDLIDKLNRLEEDRPAPLKA